MAYTALDLTTSVQDDLNDANYSSTRILKYLNYGQQAIFDTHMFKFSEKAVVGALTIGDYTFEQQSDHQTTIGGSLVDPSNTGRVFVLDEDTYLDARTFFQYYPNPSVNTNGMPAHWTEFGEQVYFDRPVDVAYNFLQRYFCRVTDMADSTAVPTVPSDFRETLEFYALYRSEGQRGNHDVAGAYKQEFDDGLENMALRYAEVTQIGPTVMGSNRVRIHES